ncbi:hypothetical protein [Pseudarthrobacter sp. TAF60_1]|uniref:hypothetical protein n=1 Tax=Pseudarthrobacter sp. TAF60_1 TaxID=3233071 RepID=UPI003F97F060
MARHQPSQAAPGGYRYRGNQPQVQDKLRTELSRLLLAKQGALRFRSSRIRDLSTSLNHMVAQALCDGASVTALSRLTQHSTGAVRGTRLAFDDLQPTGVSPTEHLRLISLLLLELTALEASKATVEEERRHLLASASRQQVLDDFELASLTGLRPEHIRKMTRGIPPKQPSKVPGRRTGISSP